MPDRARPGRRGRRTSPVGSVATFASLKVRNYRLYFSGQIVSVAGTWMQNVALGWLVLQISHSGSALGIMTALRFLPTLVLGPWGGLVADRRDRRQLMFVSQLASAAVSAALTVVVAVRLDSLIAIYLLSLLLGLVNVVANPVRQTLVGDLVPPELLGNAVALNSISVNVSRVVGPMFAGVVIAGLGVAWCFALNVLSFGTVLLSLALIDTTRLYRSPRAPRATGQIREGFRYLRHTPELMLPMVMIAVIGTFAWEFQVSLPLVATETFHGDARTYGVLLGSLGLGATMAGLWIARRAEVSLRSVSLSAVALALALTLAALMPVLWLTVPAVVIVGWATISFSVQAKSLLQLRSAPHLRGRVMAIWAVAWQGTTPVGGPIVGWVGQHLGGRATLVVGAVPTLAVAVLGLIGGVVVAAEPGGPAVAGEAARRTSLGSTMGRAPIRRRPRPALDVTAAERAADGNCGRAEGDVR